MWEIGSGLKFQPDYVRESIEPIKEFCKKTGGLLEYAYDGSGLTGRCTFPYKRGVVSIRVEFPDEETARSPYRTGKILKVSVQAHSEKYKGYVYEVKSKIHGESRVQLRKHDGEVCLGVGALSPAEARVRSIYVCATDTDKTVEREASIRVIEPLSSVIYTPRELHDVLTGNYHYGHPGHSSVKVIL